MRRQEEAPPLMNREERKQMYIAMSRTTITCHYKPTQCTSCQNAFSVCLSDMDGPKRGVYFCIHCCITFDWELGLQGAEVE